MAANEEARKLRGQLVRSLREKGELTDPLLEAAFLKVPRHEFLPELPLDKAYSDEALPVKRDPDGSIISSSSQPIMMAMMLQQLDLQPGHNVLEIGTGTGYNAAIIQEVVGSQGKVTTLEVEKDLVQQVEYRLQKLAMGSIRVVHTDAAGGYAPRAAYDRIIATAGVWDVPAAWVRQLKPQGIIVAPLWLHAMQVSAALHREADDVLYSDTNLPCGFIRMRGASAGPTVMRQVGSSPLILTSDSVPTLDSAALHALLSEPVEIDLLDIRLESSDYFQGVLPYFILHPPPHFTFAAYALGANQQAYGISGQGFALMRPGSACFVPFQGHGQAHSFGAPDAFMEIQHMLHQWHQAGRPDWQSLRLRLYPKSRPAPEITEGQIYTRQDHYIHAWLEH